ncbi:MAG: tRNA pseudouridine(38-40) synthase TruA [Alphaproteobacteria bacterium]|nr:tRNA pseudouridine(38-40) synthase TruA [Alphaproteobacteria bacterium]
MARWKLTIEYDGRPFSGWQRQDNGPSVQATLEHAIAKLTGETITIAAAGRTDAGVHALGQVAHADIEKAFSPDKMRDALNAHLRPHPVAVLQAEIVADDFHARFDATARHYRFLIVNRRSPLTIDAGKAWLVQAELDAGAMHEAAQYLVGHHDFTTFRAAECQAKSPMKTLDVLNVMRAGDDISIEASARSFLHHQVRSITGTLKQVGVGKWTPADVGAALAARDRSACGPVSPPDGLYLVRVDYGVKSTSST